MEKNKKKSKDLILKILIGVVIVLVCGLIVVWFINRNNLDIESEKIKELHNYFSSNNLGTCEGLFNYSDGLVEYDKVNSEIRSCIAFQKANVKEDDTEVLEAVKKKAICKKDDMIFRTDEDESKECTIFKVEKSLIDNTYRKLYGKDNENIESFRYDNLHMCYLKEDYYYCGLSETFTYTIGGESIIYRVMNRAKKEGSDIVIYDYFARIIDNKCYKNYTASTINEDCTNEYGNQKKVTYDFMKKYSTEFKHIYREAEDGTYYWVSSEPISKKS